MICSLCHLLHYKKHNFKDLSSMATETKAEFQTLLIKIRYGEKNYYNKCLISSNYINPSTGMDKLLSTFIHNK